MQRITSPRASQAANGANQERRDRCSVLTNLPRLQHAEHGWAHTRPRTSQIPRLLRSGVERVTRLTRHGIHRHSPAIHLLLHGLQL